MDIYQAIILALVQGITEFLPISSSAHLILLPQMVNWPDQGLSFDIMVHFGTLSAVVLYFRKKITILIKDFFVSITHLKLVGQSQVSWGIILATIPVGIIGLITNDFISNHLRNITVIAISSIFFGLILLFADIRNRQITHKLNIIDFKDMFIIGLAQAVALIPGTSRSGITISAAFLLGINRKLALEFAFLLSIPVIVLSTGLEIIKIINHTNYENIFFLVIGFIVSALTAYITISLFMKFIEKFSLTIWVIYRIILGIILLSI